MTEDWNAILASGETEDGVRPPDFAPGDPDGLEFRAEQERQARQKAVDEGAEDLLLRRDVTRRADELERERSGIADSWEFADLTEAFDADPLAPTVGAFIDSEKSNGGRVFYAGKINEVHGPSESGKTMLALAVAAQEIRAGNHVVMIDFEDDAVAVTGRMRFVFGLTKEQIVEYFHYINPAQAFDDRAYSRISTLDGVTMVIIDAVTEAMSAANLGGRDENEVASWYMSFPRRLADLGWAVCLVDHSPMDNVTRAVGSQHKKSAITGVSYTAEKVAPFAKGRRGKLRLRVAKDKPGGIRSDALPSKDAQEWRGDLVIDGTVTPNAPEVALWGVEPALFTEKDDSHLDKGVIEPLSWENRERVLLAVKKQPGLSKSALAVILGGNKSKALATVEVAVEQGLIKAEKHGQATKHYPAEPVPDDQEEGHQFQL